MTDRAPTLENGYAEGRPADREPHPLDAVVQGAIERLRAETRLYPDVYAWQVTAAVLDAEYTREVEARALEAAAVALRGGVWPGGLRVGAEASARELEFRARAVREGRL